MIDYAITAFVAFCLGIFFDRMLLSERWERARSYEQRSRELLSGKRPEGRA